MSYVPPLYDLFYRNPLGYMRELIECDETDFAWDYGYLAKRKTDPNKYAELYIGRSRGWRNLLIGEQGCPLYENSDTPSAVYPMWSYRDNTEKELLELIQHPWGSDRSYCSDTTLSIEHRPVYGQPHVVVISDLPNLGTLVGKNFMTWLKRAQDTYPEVTLHIHGAYSYNYIFGGGFFSGDVDSKSDATGHVRTGTGKVLKTAYARLDAQDMIIPFGFSPKQLDIPRNRCMYNIKTARWAATHWGSNQPTQIRRIADQPIDITTPEDKWSMPKKGNLLRSSNTKPGDKVMCDRCSLQMDCSLYRIGSVCILPESEGRRLSELLNSRNSNDILTGLSAIVARQTERLESALDREEAAIQDAEDEGTTAKLDPGVDSLINNVFKNGVALAKLVDPNLGVKIKIDIGAGVAAKAVAQADPKELAATAVNELMAAGYKIDEITDEVLEKYLRGNQQLAIEGSVVEVKDEPA